MRGWAARACVVQDVCVCVCERARARVRASYSKTRSASAAFAGSGSPASAAFFASFASQFLIASLMEVICGLEV